jgi:hypothetical protein
LQELEQWSIEKEYESVFNTGEARLIRDISLECKSIMEETEHERLTMG